MWYINTTNVRLMQNFNLILHNFLKKLQCISSRDIALERNGQRDANRRYNEEIFSALILRYEDPLSTNRWDSPLFNAMYDKLDSIADQIGQVLFDGKSVKPNLSTVSVRIDWCIR